MRINRFKFDELGGLADHFRLSDLPITVGLDDLKKGLGSSGPLSCENLFRMPSADYALSDQVRIEAREQLGALFTNTDCVYRPPKQRYEQPVNPVAVLIVDKSEWINRILREADLMSDDLFSRRHAMICDATLWLWPYGTRDVICLNRYRSEGVRSYSILNVNNIRIEETYNFGGQLF